MTSNRIAVLMTTFNRPTHTKTALDALNVAAVGAGVEVTAYVADASTNRLTRCICESFAFVRYLRVSPETFWARGMWVSNVMAPLQDFDYILWLNDDVRLDPTALEVLLRESKSRGDSCVIAGATRDPLTSSPTYGGYISTSRIAPLSLRQVGVGASAQLCDTLNGNVVLVPEAVDRRAGRFPKQFGHAMADLAYGFNARRNGILLVQASGTVGVCARNAVEGTWQDQTIPLRRRLRLLSGPKGLPFRAWSRLCLLYGGPLGALLVVKPIVDVIRSSSATHAGKDA